MYFHYLVQQNGWFFFLKNDPTNLYIVYHTALICTAYTWDILEQYIYINTFHISSKFNDIKYCFFVMLLAERHDKRLKCERSEACLSSFLNFENNRCTIRMLIASITNTSHNWFIIRHLYHVLTGQKLFTLLNTERSGGEIELLQVIFLKAS